MKKYDNGLRGFTLIELLVVVAIIGVLAAFIVPAIMTAINSAKRARALGQMADLEGAIKRYFAEYHLMPTVDNGNADKIFTGSAQAKVIEVLINSSTDDSLNPRQIVFLDLDPKSFVDSNGKPLKTLDEMKNALRNHKPYCDPWGGEYGILMDLNFDDKIDGVSIPGGASDLRRKVGVYSWGDEKANDPDGPQFKTW